MYIFFEYPDEGTLEVLALGALADGLRGDANLHFLLIDLSALVLLEVVLEQPGAVGAETLVHRVPVDHLIYR